MGIYIYFGPTYILHQSVGMDLQEFTSPLPKPWLDINCDELNCRALTAETLEVKGRVVQESSIGGRLTPFTQWRGTNNVPVSGNTLVFAMGAFVGNTLIPASECYNGMAVKVKLSGSITTTGAQTTTFSIRDLAGAVTYGSLAMAVGGAVVDRAFDVEFSLQVQQIGGAGTGSIVSGAVALQDLGTMILSSSTNNTTFDSTGGLNFYAYAQNSDINTVATLKVRYCLLEA